MNVIKYKKNKTSKCSRRTNRKRSRRSNRKRSRRTNRKRSRRTNRKRSRTKNEKKYKKIQKYNMNSPQLKRSNSVELRNLDVRRMKSNLKMLRQQVQDFKERINAMSKDNRTLTSQLKKCNRQIEIAEDKIFNLRRRK